VDSIGEPPAWRSNPAQKYVPLLFEDEVIGYCDPEYAAEITEVMNEQEVLRKALRLACLDILRRLKKDTQRVDELVDRYIQRAERPKSGPRAIALLMVERQRELGLSQGEFLKFCDTFKISAQDLISMAEGKPISPALIAPISRVLGKTPTEVEAILNGSNHA